MLSRLVRAVVLALFLAPRAASADDAPMDVMLGNGRLIRGVVIERARFRYIVVRGENGATEKFVWSELSQPTVNEIVAIDERVRRVASLAERGFLYTGPDAAYVRLRVLPVATRHGHRVPGAMLYDAESGAALCPLPCEALVDPKRAYSVRGEMPRSAPFTVPPRATLALAVNGGSDAHALGAFFMGLGGVVLATSLVVLAADRDHPASAAYGIFAGVGVSLGGAGIWLLRTPTTVQAE